LCQADQIAIVINKYSVVQTGANTQSGGLRTDLFRDEYQGSFEVIVATLPRKDTENVTNIKIIKDKNLFFNIMIYISPKNE
tara:strand:+ start:95 stop:337 length:243 start_codon:yes stop_codon:yes gene_type:complete